MLYVGMLAFTLLMVAGSIAFVASGQHSKRTK
jgi:hypothetical protein